MTAMADYPRIYVATPSAEVIKHGLRLTLVRDELLKPGDQIHVVFPDNGRFFLFVRSIDESGLLLEVDAVIIPHGRWIFDLPKAEPSVWVVEFTTEQRKLLSVVSAEIYRAAPIG